MKHYRDILVSPVNLDFGKISAADAPRRFYADWFDLVVRLTKAIHPPFEVPAFPEVVEFKADNYETNPITDVYYFIDSKIFNVKGAGDYAVEIRSHEGFQEFDGDDYIEMKPLGLPNFYPSSPYISSTISLNSAESAASFSVDAEPEFLAAVDEILAERRNL